jgi:hypothetical protein
MAALGEMRFDLAIGNRSPPILQRLLHLNPKRGVINRQRLAQGKR